MAERTITDGNKLIDLERVIQAKSPALAPYIPGFLIRYLKRIIHQDDVNRFITKSGHLQAFDFVDAIMAEFNAEIKVIGIEHIPVEGRVIIASNHPLGGPDGIALMQQVGRVRTDLQFPVNDILMFLENLKPLFIPINKHGSNAENIRVLNDTFAGEAVICYFPFGLVSRKRKGVIADLEWKKTFISKAKRFKRAVIPTHISGRNSDFFYRLANIRKALGIKMNIEMLYLADEFYKQSGKDIQIKFSQPIPYTVFDRRYPDAEWAEKLRRYVYWLGAGNNGAFDPDEDYEISIKN
jgi:putative hemolysin